MNKDEYFINLMLKSQESDQALVELVAITALVGFVIFAAGLLAVMTYEYITENRRVRRLKHAPDDLINLKVSESTKRRQRR